MLRPVGTPGDYSGGRIERIDPETGEVNVLYTHCGEHALRGPNDIVFDAAGGFYFTDLGKTHRGTGSSAASTTPWRTARRSSRSRIRC